MESQAKRPFMDESLEKERARLEALEKLNLMDTEPEERFDRICRVASKLLNAPVAYVSLLDSKRQFFKSAVGVDGMNNLPREHTFCTHTVAAESCLYVPDAAKDERFQDNPFVAGEPGVRCYLGEPLFSVEGEPVGTFCVLDLVPRDLNEEKRKVFKDLASLAERELNLLAQLHQQRSLTELTSHLSSSLDQREIVQTLLRSLQDSISFDFVGVTTTRAGETHCLGSLSSGKLTETCEAETLEVPILYREKDFGILTVKRAQAIFTRIEKELVAAFVVQSGMILYNREVLANLFEQSRNASIGSLAAGVAHEINSPLGAAKLSLESALKQVDSSQEKLQKRLTRANQAIVKASSVIKTVLQYAGEGPELSSSCDLAQVTEQTLTLLQHDLQSKEVEVRLADNQAELWSAIRPDDLQTIVQHLVRNAIWAVGESGVDEAKVNLKVGTEDGFHFLRVTDDGPGVEEEDASRIFDPFFTTKAPGQGLGLGLSVSRKLAENIGGSLKLLPDSPGAHFELRLPIQLDP